MYYICLRSCAGVIIKKNIHKTSHLTGKKCILGSGVCSFLRKGNVSGEKGVGGVSDRNSNRFRFCDIINYHDIELAASVTSASRPARTSLRKRERHKRAFTRAVK